jgi:hypothetical protein
MPRSSRGFRTRRGRPPASRPIVDTGTPELAAKRALGHTSEVIDRLLQQAAITEQQHRCALDFRRLYRLRFGCPDVQAVDLTRSHHYSTATDDSQWRQERNQQYRMLADVLHSKGLLMALLRVAVFDDPLALHPCRGRSLRTRFIKATNELSSLRNQHSHPTCRF